MYHHKLLKTSNNNASQTITSYRIGRMLPNTFYEVSTLLIQNPDTDRIKRKLLTKILDEHRQKYPQ
jgi:hypothetical protein